MKHYSLLVHQQNEIVRLRSTGISVADIANKVNTSVSTVYRFLKTYMEDNNPSTTQTSTDSPNTDATANYVNSNIKTLLIDIETAPAIAYTFGRRKIYLSDDNIAQEGRILSIAFKWLHETEIHYINAPTEEDEPVMLALLYDVLEDADIVIGHNIKHFDMPVINSRLAYHSFPPPHNFKIYDTYDMVKRNFRFPANRLDSLCKHLDIGSKLEHEGIKLWIAVMNGDEDAWELFKQYNIQDVRILEELYLMLRGFDQKHPNVNPMIATGERRCTTCGSLDVTETSNTVYTPVSAFVEYKCNCCGKRSRARQNLIDPKNRTNIMANITN